MTIARTALLVAAAGTVQSGALGAMVIGSPITVPADGASVSVTYVGSSAAWTGILYWIEPADDLAAELFHNKLSAPGESYDLGLFEPFEPILFAYEITHGVQDIYFMDDPIDVRQFSYTDLGGGLYRVGVEDIKLPGGDHDYNDLMFDVQVTPVPGPGALALLGLGGVRALRRRR